MTKKIANRKLVLGKQTLRNLREDALERVVGGMSLTGGCSINNGCGPDHG